MRRFILLSICLCLLLLCCTDAYAHSGKTDSNGGHWNHSTGKYHYHHGYSAHDHYDMNGDGIVDCPYDFDDTTNVVNKSNAGITSRPKEISKPTTDNPNTSVTEKSKKIHWGAIVENFPFVVGGFSMLLITISWIVHIFSENLGELLMSLSLYLLGLFIILILIYLGCFILKTAWDFISIIWS